MKPITFNTTHWSVVLAAKGDNTRAYAALSELCQSYRKPILRYIEGAVRTGDSYDGHSYGGRSAEDLAHDFLVQLLEARLSGKGLLEHVQQREGRFRIYLLGAVRYFLSNVRQQESATKRGGNIVHVPIPDNLSTTDNTTLFDREWAQTMLDRAITLLGKAQETRMLLPWLTQEMTAEESEPLAMKLGKSESAVKVALHRLRRKFRRLVREQIAHTVESEKEIDAELDHLIRALTQ